MDEKNQSLQMNSAEPSKSSPQSSSARPSRLELMLKALRETEEKYAEKKATARLLSLVTMPSVRLSPMLKRNSQMRFSIQLLKVCQDLSRPTPRRQNSRNSRHNLLHLISFLS